MKKKKKLQAKPKDAILLLKNGEIRNTPVHKLSETISSLKVKYVMLPLLSDSVYKPYVLLKPNKMVHYFSSCTIKYVLRYELFLDGDEGDEFPFFFPECSVDLKSITELYSLLYSLEQMAYYNDLLNSSAEWGKYDQVDIAAFSIDLKGANIKDVSYNFNLGDEKTKTNNVYVFTETVLKSLEAVKILSMPLTKTAKVGFIEIYNNRWESVTSVDVIVDDAVYGIRGDTNMFYFIPPDLYHSMLDLLHYEYSGVPVTIISYEFGFDSLMNKTMKDLRQIPALEIIESSAGITPVYVNINNIQALLDLLFNAKFIMDTLSLTDTVRLSPIMDYKDTKNIGPVEVFIDIAMNIEDDGYGGAGNVNKMSIRIDREREDVVIDVVKFILYAWDGECDGY